MSNESVNDMLQDRISVYGDFASQADISQCLKHIVQSEANWKKMNYVQKEAIELILHKIARIMNGNPYYIDSWRDLVGYSQLVVNALAKDSRAVDSTVVMKPIKTTDLSE